MTDKYKFYYRGTDYRINVKELVSGFAWDIRIYDGKEKVYNFSHHNRSGWDRNYCNVYIICALEQVIGTIHDNRVYKRAFM